MENKYLVYNWSEWLTLGKILGITEEDLKNADEKGFIKTSNGIDCYLSRLLNVI